jgi:hypothetical protein
MNHESDFTSSDKRPIMVTLSEGTKMMSEKKLKLQLTVAVAMVIIGLILSSVEGCVHILT